MPKKGRYAHLKGSSAYYPFGARTSLRKKQRMRVVLLRLLGLALIVPVALFFFFQIFFNGGQPKPPIGVTATPETASSGPVSVTVQPATVNAPQNVQTPESTAETENAILPKYQDLYAQNSDLVGWLTIDAIGVDYPVMQTPGDNEYYLRRGFDKVYSLAGSLFLDENCRITSPSTANWLIYGHNMSDGSMFGQLDKYAEESFYIRPLSLIHCMRRCNGRSLPLSVPKSERMICPTTPSLMPPASATGRQSIRLSWTLLCMTPA